MVFKKNALTCIKKVKIINHDCLPILMLLYVMLYIMLAYLMLFAALSNAVCLHNNYLIIIIINNSNNYYNNFAIDFCKCFLFHALSWFVDT